MTDRSVLDPLRDTKFAAHYLGDVSRWTLIRERKRGRLKAVIIGGSVRYAHSELDRYRKAAAERDRAA